MDSSAHRATFIRAYGVSAKSTFLSALSLVLRGNAIVSVSVYNVHVYCMPASGEMVHTPHMCL